MRTRFVCLSVSLLAVACFNIQAAPIISADGTAYSSYTASSELNSDYTVDNLFDQNPTVGAEITTSGSDAGFAYGGTVNTSPLYVEFQLDTSYEAQSLYYAQRDFNNNHLATVDKIGTIEVWVSASTPFSATNPFTSPDATVSITNLSDDKYLEYSLSSVLTGKYFLIRLTQASGQSASVFGGTEFRLGGIIPEPSTTALFLGATAFGLAASVRRRIKKAI